MRFAVWDKAKQLLEDCPTVPGFDATVGNMSDSCRHVLTTQNPLTS